MKKRELITLALALAFAAPLVFGFGGSAPTPAPQNPNEAVYPILIDNFEDGDITTAPTWWKFDNVTLKVDQSFKYKGGDADVEKGTGQYVLSISGTAKNWYVGGFGAYVAKDCTGYNAVSVDVYGTGRNSGKMKIELYDDDNGNTQIEQNPRTYQPLNDDRFIYEFDVNWTGWKNIKVPFSAFKDDNPGVGDGVLNLDAKNGSGGLVQIQFIIVASDQTGSVNMAVDNIEITQ